MGDYGTSGTASTASTVGDAASLYSSMANIGTAADTAGTAASTAGSAGSAVGPVASGAGAVDSFGNAAGTTYNTAAINPSWMDRAMSLYDDYQKGAGQNMSDAWKNRGWNMKTAGYVGNKLENFAKMGGGGGPARPADINVNYQAPGQQPDEMTKLLMMRRQRGY